MAAEQTFAAYVEYDGRAFVGWQSQQGLRSVQQQIEQALSRVAAHPIQVRCAGRTDAGVHALGQVIHFRTSAERSLRSWLLGCNANLPADISLYWLGPVASEFDARFLAISRRYRYLVWNATARSAIWAGRCCYEPRKIDLNAMRAAAAHLLGQHDFSSFRGRDCQARSAVKTVQQLSIEHDQHWLSIDIEAGGFLHNMVRNIVGSLLLVGHGAKSADWMLEVLQQRDRRVAGPTAVPDGLYFVGAKYEDKFGLPEFRPLQLPR